MTRDELQKRLDELDQLETNLILKLAEVRGAKSEIQRILMDWAKRDAEIQPHAEQKEP